MHKENIHFNRAVVLLVKARVSFYSVAIALGQKDKRNIVRIYERDKNKYFIKKKKK